VNIYRILIRETSSLLYEIEAETEKEARLLLWIGDEKIISNDVSGWDIVEITKVKEAT
tara:strand:+ start:628 stop:801 length:174 start_codon:yes stop_codon:yes gene_type:complete